MASHGRHAGIVVVAGAALVLFGCMTGVAGVVTPEGVWVGSYATSESGGELALRIRRTGNGWTVEARATSPYVASPEYQRGRDVSVGTDSLTFTLDWGSAVRWVGTLQGDTLSGSIDADHWTGSWTVTRAVPAGRSRSIEAMVRAGR